MSQLKIHSRSGEEIGDFEIAEDLLSDAKKGNSLHQVIVGMGAAARGGNASTLNKSEVAGTGAKPWKQKGTGRARAGYKQSPVWRGGSVAFGPRPRQYGFKTNKKSQRQAFQAAFSERCRAGEIKVVEDLSVPEIKTKAFLELIGALGVTRGALLVVDHADRNLLLSARNVPGVEVATAEHVNTMQFVRHETVLVSRAGMELLKERLAKVVGRAK